MPFGTYNYFPELVFKNCCFDEICGVWNNLSNQKIKIKIHYSFYSEFKITLHDITIEHLKY